MQLIQSCWLITTVSTLDSDYETMQLFKLMEVLPLFSLQEVFILVDILMNHCSYAGEVGMSSFFEVFKLKL